MKFNTAESFLLLSLNPNNGGFLYSGQQVNIGLIGSIFFDLAIYEKIEIEDQLLTFKTSQPKDSITSEINRILGNAEQPRKVQYWINKFISRSPQIKWQVLKFMEARDLISIEHQKLLGIFSHNKCFVMDHDLRSQTVRKLRDCVLRQTDLYTENVALLALLEACKMYKVLTHDRRELKLIKPALKEIIKENPIAMSVAYTLNDLQSAFIASISSATSPSTAVSS